MDDLSRDQQMPIWAYRGGRGLNWDSPPGSSHWRMSGRIKFSAIELRAVTELVASCREATHSIGTRIIQCNNNHEPWGVGFPDPCFFFLVDFSVFVCCFCASFGTCKPSNGNLEYFLFRRIPAASRWTPATRQFIPFHAFDNKVQCN